MMQTAEDTLDFQLRALGLDGWVREYRFDPSRRWRADFAFPASRILVEVEGGTWQQGRHTRGAGYASDCEKYNAATEQGWRVLRYTSEMVKSGQAVAQIIRMLEGTHGH